MSEAVALLALAAMVIVVVWRPARVPEVVVAVPAVGVVLAIGAVSAAQARAELRQLGPVVGFLAAVLVLADCAGDDGVFRAAGALVATVSGRSSYRLLLAVVVLASVTTALLSLDTTVVLLTPVVIATTRQARALPRPALYATAHLANSASLLLPVSNLTNLLAFAVVPVSFGRFAALMAFPWLVAIAVEVAGVRRVFAADLRARLAVTSGTVQRWPRFASSVVAVTVVGFAVGSGFGLAPVWPASAGAAVLVVHRLAARRTTVIAVVRSASVSFCLFVLGLGIVVRAVSAGGLGHVVRHLVPSGSGLVALLGVAGVAAVLSNLMNNLPATLLLLPIAATGGLGPVLATLIGVNLGPNLSYPGSLATLLWRREVNDVDGVPRIGDFTRLGLATVPLGIAASTVALWLSLRWIGTT